MARYLNGIIGPYIGKVGTVSGSHRRGIPYMKGQHKARKTDISEKEILNRENLRLLRPGLSH